MSKLSKVRDFYDSGLWTVSMVSNAVVKSWITAEEYAERIKAAMKDFPSKLPERAYQDVLEIYNTDVMKKKYIAFYNDVINRKYER